MIVAFEKKAKHHTIPGKPMAVITTFVTVIGALKFNVHHVELPLPVNKYIYVVLFHHD